MNRRFEFVAGNSAKFWEISQSGCTVTVRFGRLGAARQELHKGFEDKKAAIKYAQKLVAQKIAKGYVECVPV